MCIGLAPEEEERILAKQRAKKDLAEQVASAVEVCIYVCMYDMCVNPTYAPSLMMHECMSCM